MNVGIKSLYLGMLAGNIGNICQAKPNALIAMAANCAKFYNCSRSNVVGNVVQECQYPDLFSVSTMKCEAFENVSCLNRSTPMAPCKYYISK